LAPSLEPDKKILALHCKNFPTQIWDTAHGQLLASLPNVTTATSGDLGSARPAVSASGDLAAIARGNFVQVYTLPGGELKRTIVHNAPVTTVAFAATGHDIVSGGLDGSLLVAHDNGVLFLLPVSSVGIDAAAFLPDGRIIAADAQQRVHVYSPTGTLLTVFDASARMGTLRMSTDSRRLLTIPSFADKAAVPEIWDVESYRPIARLEAQGQGQVYSARFVAGAQIITACGDGAARLWDSTTGQLLRTYRGGSRFLVDVAISTDGSILIGGDGDGMLRFWDAVSGRPLWTMQAHKSRVVEVAVDEDEVVTRGSSGEISRWSLPKQERVIANCDAHEHCASMSQ